MSVCVILSVEPTVTLFKVLFIFGKHHIESAVGGMSSLRGHPPLIRGAPSLVDSRSSFLNSRMEGEIFIFFKSSERIGALLHREPLKSWYIGLHL